MRRDIVTQVLTGSVSMPDREAFDQLLGELVAQAGSSLREAQLTADSTAMMDWDSARNDAVAKAFTEGKRRKLEGLLQPWRERTHMREHAMLALIPLLHTLSPAAAQWLVHASFTVVDGDHNDQPVGAIANFGTTVANVLGIEVALLDPGCFDTARFPPRNAAASNALY